MLYPNCGANSLIAVLMLCNLSDCGVNKWSCGELIDEKTCFNEVKNDDDEDYLIKE